MSKTPPTNNAEKPASGGPADFLPYFLGIVSVKYLPATNCRPSRWAAKISRGSDLTFKAVVSFDYSGKGNNGADAAARACLAKFTAWANEGRSTDLYSHKLTGHGSLGNDGFIYTFETI